MQYRFFFILLNYHLFAIMQMMSIKRKSSVLSWDLFSVLKDLYSMIWNGYVSGSSPTCDLDPGNDKDLADQDAQNCKVESGLIDKTNCHKQFLMHFYCFVTFELFCASIKILFRVNVMREFIFLVMFRNFLVKISLRLKLRLF